MSDEARVYQVIRPPPTMTPAAWQIVKCAVGNWIPGVHIAPERPAPAGWDTLENVR